MAVREGGGQLIRPPPQSAEKLALALTDVAVNRLRSCAELEGCLTDDDIRDWVMARLDDLIEDVTLQALGTRTPDSRWPRPGRPSPRSPRPGPTCCLPAETRYPHRFRSRRPCRTRSVTRARTCPGCLAPCSMPGGQLGTRDDRDGGPSQVGARDDGCAAADDLDGGDGDLFPVSEAACLRDAWDAIPVECGD